MYNLFLGLLIVASVVIIVTTLIMEPKTEGMGTIGGDETNLFGQSAIRKKERLLNRVTVAAAVVFLISSIMLSVLSTKAAEKETTTSLDTIEIVDVL